MEVGVPTEVVPSRARTSQRSIALLHTLHVGWPSLWWRPASAGAVWCRLHMPSVLLSRSRSQYSIMEPLSIARRSCWTSFRRTSTCVREKLSSKYMIESVVLTELQHTQKKNASRKSTYMFKIIPWEHHIWRGSKLDALFHYFTVYSIFTLNIVKIFRYSYLSTLVWHTRTQNITFLFVYKHKQKQKENVNNKTRHFLSTIATRLRTRWSVNWQIFAKKYFCSW